MPCYDWDLSGSSADSNCAVFNLWVMWNNTYRNVVKEHSSYRVYESSGHSPMRMTARVLFFVFFCRIVTSQTSRAAAWFRRTAFSQRWTGHWAYRAIYPWANARKLPSLWQLMVWSLCLQLIMSPGHLANWISLWPSEYGVRSPPGPALPRFSNNISKGVNYGNKVNKTILCIFKTTKK